MTKNNHYCVIMAGGIGSRFWPLSRSRIPKQFIDIVGTGQSLLQMTYHRFKKIIPEENIYIVTNHDYRELVKQHLPSIRHENILTEPFRKNTAPCIAYASHYIASKNPNALMVVAPSDHLILKQEEFLQIIAKGLQFIEQEKALLTLGIKPTRPETGYGYIQVKKDHKSTQHPEVLKVKTFTEKPNIEMARIFYESGDFFWNSGIFLWSVDTIHKAFETFLPDIHSLFEKDKTCYGTPRENAFIQQVYAHCPNISIDYGIMEKAQNVYMLPADIGWSDLGTWGSMHENSVKDRNQNVINRPEDVFMYNTDRCLVNIHPDKIAVLEGLQNYIVVDTEDVLLICHRDNEQLIKNYVNDVKMKKGEKYI